MRKGNMALLVILVFLFVSLSAFFYRNAIFAATIYFLVNSLMSEITPKLLVQAIPIPPFITDLLNILGSTVGITVIGSVVTGSVTLLITRYQMRYQARLNERDQKEQFEFQQKLLRERTESYEKLQFDLLREQEEIRRLRKAVRKDRSDTTLLERLRRDALSQPDIYKRAEIYRQVLQNDPRLSQIQILDMPQPLEILRFHVPMRLQQSGKRSYKLDNEVLFEPIRDTRQLIRREITFLEQHTHKAIAPAEAIRVYRRCVIVGDPGAGKTTLLKYLALKSAAGELNGLPDLPIFIELNAFATSGFQDLLDFAAIKWDADYGFRKNDARGYMEDMLSTGNALLLLDALDEVVIGSSIEEAEASYYRIAGAIKQVATRYYQAPIVITARKLGYQQRESIIGFTEFELQEFRPEDIKQFVTRWFDYMDEEEKRANAVDLNAKLERTPHIQALATNPLLLSLIVRVYEQQLDLPERRAELYKRCVDLLLSGWDAQRNVRRYRDLEQKHTRQLLEQVAWHFHQQGRRYFPANELLREIADFLPTVQLPAERNGQVLMSITSENGLLKEHAQEVYGFFHLTLQEYFVAQYMSNNQELAQLLMHRGDPWWEETCFLYAGHMTDASLLLRILMGQGETIKLQEDVFHTNLILAGRCLVARPTIRQVALWEEIVSQLEYTLLHTPYALTKERIIQVLVAIGEAGVIERLLGLLSDSQVSRELRVNIAQALGMQRDPIVMSKLRVLFDNARTDSHVRSSIIQTLGMSGDYSMVPRLLDMIQDQSLDWHVREGIVQCLAILGGNSMRNHFLTLLQNEHIEWYIRSRIAQALGVLGDRAAVRPLLRLLARQQEKASYLTNEITILVNIVQTLGVLGDVSAIPDLLILLQNQQIDVAVRIQIAQTLGILSDYERSVIPALQSLLVDQRTDIFTRSSIIYALALQGIALDLEIRDLVNLLNRHISDNYIPNLIIQTLGVLRARSAVPDLLEKLQMGHLDPYVRICIVQTLAGFAERQTLPPLLALLSDPQVDKLVRSNIAQSLSHFANIMIVNEIEKLIELLDNSDVASDIHHALWIVSRRRGLRIFIINEQGQKRVRIIKWQE